MVFYVVYRAPSESSDRRIIIKQLRDLNCKPIHRGFWKIDEEKCNNVLSILEKNKPVILKRSRDINKTKFEKNGTITDLGSLIIVMYAVPKEIKREKIKNLLKRAPFIRLRRCVYAFSHTHAVFDKDKKLIDAIKFSNFIKEIQEDVKVIPRMEIVNKFVIERLLNETKERVEKDIENIMQSSKELYSKINKNDIENIRHTLFRYRRRLIILKKVSSYYEKWLRLDFSKNIMKTYRVIEKVKSELNNFV